MCVWCVWFMWCGVCCDMCYVCMYVCGMMDVCVCDMECVCGM